MQRWFAGVDEKKISIHLLSVYQLAESYIDDLESYYRAVVEIYTNSGNFFYQLHTGTNPTNIGRSS